MNDRYSQDLAAEIVATLDPQQRTLFLAFVRTLCQEAEIEGAGTGIWYIYRAIEDRVMHPPRQVMTDEEHRKEVRSCEIRSKP